MGELSLQVQIDVTASGQRTITPLNTGFWWGSLPRTIGDVGRNDQTMGEKRSIGNRWRLLLLSLAMGLGVVLLAPSVASADDSQAWPSEDGIFNGASGVPQTISLNQCAATDAAGGELSSVTLSSAGSVIGTLAGALTTGGEIEARIDNLSFVVDAGAVTVSENTDDFAQTFDLAAGPAEETFTSAIGGSVTLTGADMAPYTGAGTFDANATFNASGSFTILGAAGFVAVTVDAAASMDVACAYAAPPANPAISIEKSTNGSDADLAADAVELVEGDAVEWTYLVTNEGDVALSNVVVSDDQVAAVNCPAAELAVGADMICTASGVAAATDLYMNTGSVVGEHEGEQVADSDPSHYKARALVPSISIEKATNGADADDPAGADVPSLVEEDPVTWTYVVLNTGETPLTNVAVNDDVEGAVCVYMDDLAAVLGVGETFTCELSAANGALLADPYANLGDVAGTVPAGYAATGETVVDDDPSHYRARKEIDLSIVKTAVPTEVQQGETGSFQIVVTNAGPSDATDVLVTDTVDALLEVTGVTLDPAAAGDCSASVGQNVSCTVNIADDPAPESVTITVDYIAAPTLGGPAQFGAVSGTEFRFVFENGYVLIGAAEEDVFLYAPDGTVTQLPDLDRQNDYPFTTPDGQTLLMHVSCSDLYANGWGETGDPTEGVHTDWRIAEFSIARYRSGGTFFKYCGDVISPFVVDNTASAAGEDTDAAGNPETETVAADASVTILEPAQRVIVDSSCLDNNGRVDVYLDNKREGESTYTVQVGAIERTQVLAEGATKKLSVTGRPDGDLNVVVLRDGVVVHEETVSVACDAPAPPEGSVEVDIVSTCLREDGRIDVTVVNGSAETITVTATFTGENYELVRSTDVRADRTRRLTVTGRPDGDVTVVVTGTGGTAITELVSVACDPEAPAELDIVNRCLGRKGRIDVYVNNTTDVPADYVVTYTGANYELVRSATVNPDGSTRLTVTGRPAGDVEVVVTRDGAEIARESYTVDC